jgi:hypothetical protein
MREEGKHTPCEDERRAHGRARFGSHRGNLRTPEKDIFAIFKKTFVFCDLFTNLGWRR